MTQGIYRYDDTVRDAVLQTPLDGELPTAHFYRLPEWCVYIETDPITMNWGGRPLHGFFAHMEYDIQRGGIPELRLLMDTAPDPRRPFDDALSALPLILTAPDLSTALGTMLLSAQKSAKNLGLAADAFPSSIAEEMVGPVAPLISLVLYLCADADITRRGVPTTPTNPSPVRTRRDGLRLFPADGPAEWDVGVRLGSALRAASDAPASQEGNTGRQLRPHVRKAHWHTMISGPRLREDKSAIPATERKRDLRWIPPIPVNVGDYDKLPAVVRSVTKNKAN